MEELQQENKSNRPIWTVVQCFALIFVSLCAVAININEVLVIIVAMLLLILIPCLLISVISFFYNIRLNTKRKRIFVIWNLINFCLLACYFVPLMGCEACNMIENYKRHIDSFAQCQAILNNKLKSGYRLYYRPGWKTEIGSYNGNQWLENRVNPDLSNDTILANIGLNKDDLKEIKRILKATDCIGINVLSEDKIELTYRQRGFGMYSYLLFNHSLSASELDSLADMCSYIPILDSVVLEYSPGATGDLCFPRCDKPHKISENELQ